MVTDQTQRVKARVQAWQKEKKNLRALLASLHEIAPPCSWNPVTLAQLIDPAMVKKSYRKALLAVHPDKQDSGDVEKKVLAQHGVVLSEEQCERVCGAGQETVDVSGGWCWEDNCCRRCLTGIYG